VEFGVEHGHHRTRGKGGTQSSRNWNVRNVETPLWSVLGQQADRKESRIP